MARCTILGQRACDDALHEKMRRQMSEEDQNKTRKLRHAQDSDKYLCGKVLPVTFPALEGGEPRVMNCAWSVKDAGLEVELTPGNLEYCIQAIQASPPVEKKQKVPKSPRSRRKRRARGERSGSQEALPASQEAQLEVGETEEDATEAPASELGD